MFGVIKRYVTISQFACGANQFAYRRIHDTYSIGAGNFGPIKLSVRTFKIMLFIFLPLLEEPK